MSTKSGLIDSAKLQINETAWYLDLERPVDVHLGKGYDHLIYEHPYFIMSRTPIRHSWISNRKLPKMEGGSFDSIVSLLTCDVVIRSMIVESIEKSENTGEFVYLDNDLEVCLPEQMLFKTRKDAAKERTRILSMVRDWANSQLGRNHEMFSVRNNHFKKQPGRRSGGRSRKISNKKRKQPKDS